jgi:hypothetical protein
MFQAQSKAFRVESKNSPRAADSDEVIQLFPAHRLAAPGSTQRRRDMRTARRLIATLVGVAMWSVVATNVAFAMRVPDPPAGQAPRAPITSGGGGTGTSNWKYALIAVLAVLLAVAIVGLIASLRHSRESRPTPMLHA